MDAALLRDRLSTDAARLRARGAVDRYSDRLHPASTTVVRIRAEFSRFGITRLADVTGLDAIGIPVWMAVRPNAKTLAVSQGKGLEHAAAQASAVMEAAELSTAEHPELARRRYTARELTDGGANVAMLNNLLGRGVSLASADEVIDWVEGFDLIAERACFVPAEAVGLDRTLSTGDGPPRYWQSSDGLASGNLLLEAVVHGLCERIERDARALWLFRSERDVLDSCIEPTLLGDEAVLGLCARIEAAGFELRLFDITTDVGVPVHFATIAPRADGRENLWKHFDCSSGSGCHPSQSRAAIRAITEAAQSRVTTIAGARDDYDPHLYQASMNPDLLAYLRARPWRAVAEPGNSPAGAADILPYLLDRLRCTGIRSAIAVPLAADLPDFAVVKVLVPDLESLPSDRRQRFGWRALKAMAAAR